MSNFIKKFFFLQILFLFGSLQENVLYSRININLIRCVFQLCTLFCAIQNENETALEIIRLHLEKGTEIKHKDAWGRTPFYYAVYDKHKSAIIRLLLLTYEKR